MRELDMCDADECDELVRRVGEFENLTCVMLTSVTSWCDELVPGVADFVNLGCVVLMSVTSWCDELANSRT